MLRSPAEEPTILWECSSNYDETVIEAHLKDLYVMFSITLDPTQYGFCGLRKRKFGVCLLRELVTAKFGNLGRALSLFRRERRGLSCSA